MKIQGKKVSHRGAEVTEKEKGKENPLCSLCLRGRIGIIGVGRVGTAIGYALHKKGYKVIADDQNPNALRRFYRVLGIRPQKQSDLSEANLIFITTQDSEIEKVYHKILSYLSKGTVIVQCSGSISNAIFKNTERNGIITIGLHPIQTFSSIKQSIGSMKNIYYAVEAQGKAKIIAKRIVRDLQGIPLFISGKDKPLYHAMCVFASNYLVALMSAVIDIAKEIKIKPDLAFKMLAPLIYQTLDNIKQSGVEKSLTGPIERRDIKTIEIHLTALRKRMPKLLPLYQTLGLKALTIMEV